MAVAGVTEMNFGSNEDKQTLALQNTLLKRKRGYTFKLPPLGSSIIILFSGGIDSVSLTYLLLKRYNYQVYPIYFILKKENREQLKAVNYFNSYFIKHFPSQYYPVEIRKFTHLFSFREIPSYQTKVWENYNLISENTSYYPPVNGYQTFFPNNPTRLGHYAFGAYDYHLSLRYVKNIVANTAFTAITHSDALMRECNLSVIRSVNVALCSITGDFSYQFSAPIEKHEHFCFDKDQLAKLAIVGKVPIDKTWSCVFMKKTHCGLCQSCMERKNLFLNLGIKDVTRYYHPLRIPFLRKIRQILSVIQPLKNSPTIGDLPDINATYTVNKNLLYKKTKEGYFIYVNTTKSYCVFSKPTEISLFKYLLSRNTMRFNKIEGKRIVNSRILTKKDLSEFLTICFSCGILLKFKKKRILLEKRK